MWATSSLCFSRLPVRGGTRPVPRKDSRHRRASTEGCRGTCQGHRHRRLSKADPSLLRKAHPLHTLPQLLKQLLLLRSSENQVKLQQRGPLLMSEQRGFHGVPKWPVGEMWKGRRGSDPAPDTGEHAAASGRRRCVRVGGYHGVRGTQGLQDARGSGGGRRVVRACRSPRSPH